MYELRLDYPVKIEKNPNWGPRSRRDPGTRDNQPNEYRMVEPFEFDTTRYQRHLAFEPGHAFRNRFGEGLANNYGISSLGMRFLVAGANGVTQFSLSTGWVPEMVTGKYGQPTLHFTDPFPMDYGYHALVPQYEDQDDYDCQYTSTGKCYYDGTGLGAEHLFDQFVMTGDVNVVWKALVTWVDDLRGPDEVDAGLSIKELSTAVTY